MRIDTVILNAERTLRQLVDAMQNRLTFRDNFHSRQIVIPDSGPADTEIIIPHRLEKIPTGYIANVDAAAIVYDSDPDNWTAEELRIKCNQSNIRISLVIF